MNTTKELLETALSCLKEVGGRFDGGHSFGDLTEGERRELGTLMLDVEDAAALAWTGWGHGLFPDAGLVDEEDDGDKPREVQWDEDGNVLYDSDEEE